jgi:hypothetical protein
MTTRALSAPARQLLSNARNLSGAADHLASGKSTFGKWCIPGLLPQQCTAVIYSPTGSGKTFLALHLALCKAAGLPWFGAPMKAGTIVYLVTEDRPGVEARAIAAANHMQLALADVPFEFMAPQPIHTDGWAKNLIEALTEIQTRNEVPIGGIFLDTIGASFGGRSQDDAAQMTLATDAMQAVSEHFKCAFVGIHHAGKDEARGMRGSQVLKDRVDTVMVLGKPKGGGTAVNVEKQRNGALSAPLTFRLAPATITAGSGSYQTLVIADLAMVTTSSPSTVPADGKLTKLSRDERAVLDIIAGADQPITVRNLGILTTPKLVEIKPRKEGAVRSAISNARKQLLHKGYIAFDAEADTVRIVRNASETQNF